jgi:hypothetical protein
LFNDCCHSRRSEEHPPTHLAIKVSFSFNAAIVLAIKTFELHPNPISGCKSSLAYIADSRKLAISELDDLANLILRHGAQVIGFVDPWLWRCNDGVFGLRGCNVAVAQY